MGRFRNDLCDCCETCPCPFWLGFCFAAVLAGQVMQRMGLNPIGMPGDSKNTCTIMAVLTIVVYFFVGILLGTTTIGYFMYLIFNIYFVVALTCARKHLRQRYNIPGTTCGDSALDDCCCVYWCGCCTVIQMHRHTHDEKVYPYDLTSKTGLPEGAPEMV